MAKDEISQLRRRIENAKGEWSRSEGEKKSLDAQIESTVEELRKVLDCEPGEEKAALAKLKKAVEHDTSELTAMLDEIEGKVDDK